MICGWSELTKLMNEAIRIDRRIMMAEGLAEGLSLFERQTDEVRAAVLLLRRIHWKEDEENGYQV